MLCCHLLRQFEWKAMCIVQLKSIFARKNGTAPSFQILEHVVEQGQAGIECQSKLLLFKAQNLHNAVASLIQFDIMSAHQIYHRIGCLCQERLIQP